ncbi:MAG: UvrD-helicase domain-containing protein [Muribaculaceae bacterium]|nr:UvrD-helicase domain-containing protein [Muribaculaceae bacterium]
MQTSEDYLSQLNPSQREAVTYCDGPQLVIAGAGSGKTRVLTYKIVHLLANGYEPWRILALTFTNKAAREMRERIQAITGPQVAAKLWMGTFHSIFARILRAHTDRIGFKPGFTIYDTADSKALVKSIIKDMDLDDKVYKVSTVLSAISSAKNALISAQQYKNSKDIIDADKRARRPMTYAIYAAYVNRCFVANAMDFDDLLYFTNVLLRDNPDVRHHYQEFFRYVLVDEYQDTNFAQHLIVHMLTRESQKLSVVGDDAQSIYSFRGANIDNILRLQEAYPGLRTFKLEQNYRSTKTITNAANSLIAKNTRQIHKNAYSENEVGPAIELVQSFSDYEEGYLVANRITALRATQHDSFEDYAILYRTNAQSRVLEESLRKRNIPYRIYGGVSFYQRQEVKDALAYFRLSLNPDDDEALRRVINTPTRGIGDTTLNRLTRAALEAGVSIWTVLTQLDIYPTGITAAPARKLADFARLIEGFAELNLRGDDAFSVAEKIITASGLLAMYLGSHTPENVAKRENLEELLNAVREFVEETAEEGGTDVSLGAFMGVASLATDQDSDDTDMQASERVTLMTVHAAKGLEFRNVFVVGVEEELFPSGMSMGSLREIEEERRLLYVAITRAKRFCMLSHARSRFRNGQTVMPQPSRFLKDIDPTYLKCTDGSGTSPYFQPGVMRSAPNDYPEPHGWGLGAPVPDRSRMVSVGRRDASTPAQTVDQHGDLSVGTEIEHQKFGRGRITTIDTSTGDVRVTVDFVSSGTKTLLLKFAKFTIVKS